MLSEKERKERAEDHYLNTIGYWIEKGKVTGIIELYQENLISLETACQKLQLTPEAFQQLLNEKY